jgi:hypothetical protein
MTTSGPRSSISFIPSLTTFSFWTSTGGSPKKEEQDIEFMTLVRNNFLRIFKAAGHDVFDATAEPGTLHRQIVERLAGLAAR